MKLKLKACKSQCNRTNEKKTERRKCRIRITRCDRIYHKNEKTRLMEIVTERDSKRGWGSDRQNQWRRRGSRCERGVGRDSRERRKGSQRRRRKHNPGEEVSLPASGGGARVVEGSAPASGGRRRGTGEQRSRERRTVKIEIPNLGIFTFISRSKSPKF